MNHRRSTFFYNSMQVYITILVADYISSPTATLFPVKELCAICRQRNIVSVVDGAHAPGQVKLDMDDLKADFFVGMY